MKKKLTSIMLTTVMVASMSITSFGASVNVVIDGRTLQSDVPAQTMSGRTMVPLSSIFQELGANVSWNEKEQKITANKNETVIELKLNNKTAIINGQPSNLDVAPTTVNGRTLVPLGFVSTALGANVSWNGTTNTATISTTGAIPKAQTYKVNKVVDGDTIKVTYNGKEEYVRMIGIDTPESVHPDASKNVPAGKVASEYTTNMLSGKDVELEFDVEQRDKYGRLLAYVYVDGKMFNKTLLEEGYAVMYTFPPNVKHVEEFKAITPKNNPYSNIQN